MKFILGSRLRGAPTGADIISSPTLVEGIRSQKKEVCFSFFFLFIYAYENKSVSSSCFSILSRQPEKLVLIVSQKEKVLTSTH